MRERTRLKIQLAMGFALGTIIAAIAVAFDLSEGVVAGLTGGAILLIVVGGLPFLKRARPALRAYDPDEGIIRGRMLSGLDQSRNCGDVEPQIFLPSAG
jgi:hypothetical protein